MAAVRTLYPDAYRAYKEHPDVTSGMRSGGEVPLDADIIVESRNYGFNNDIFDAAIVATAKLKDVPLITRDTAIIESGLIEIYW